MGGGERAVRHPFIILEHMFELMSFVAGQRPFGDGFRLRLCPAAGDNIVACAALV
ncbi:hypothetical protein GCM10009610_03750 [Pseudonocardia xinjiangensis]